MISYFGDFAEDDTVLIPFNTFDSKNPSASVTVTNLVAADIKVHKDGGLTQIATDGATVVIDFDSITGNHLITIDTSVHADYAVGSEYAVRIEGVTVDAGTINAWVGAFSIERAGGVLALIKAGNLSANVVQLGGVTQSATDLKDFADAGYDPATNKVTGVLLTDTVTTYTGNTLQTGDVITAINDLANGTDGLGAIKADTAAILTDTADMQPKLGTPAGTDISADIADVPTVAEMNARTLVAASYFDPAADAVANVTLVATTTTNTDMVGTDSAALASVVTVARMSELDAGTAGKMANQVDIIQTDTTTDIPATITTAQADLDIITGATGVNLLNATQASIDAIETDTSTTLDTKLNNLDLGIIYGATAGTPTTTSTNTDLTGYATSELVGRVIIFTGGTANGQAATIATYTSTNGVVTFAALTTAPAASDTFKIV